MRNGHRIVPAAALIGVLIFSAPRAVRAAGDVEYKYEDYREADGRIAVQTESGSIDQDLPLGTNLMLTGTIDAIAGATPTGQPAPAGSSQVVTTEMHERRKEWTGDLSRQFGNVNLDAGFADSRESDYVSAGWSVKSTVDFNQKNTTLLLGLAGTSDRVEAFFEPVYLPKHTGEGNIGLTQLIDPLTYITIDFTSGQASGYLSEQRKLVTKTVQFFPGVFLLESFGENRPDRRYKNSVFLLGDHAFPAIGGSVEGSYRFYHDSFGVNGNTFELAWYQHLGEAFVLRPSFRYYSQTASWFYYYNLDETSIIPVPVPTGRGPNYSSDYRLSALDDWAVGLKAIWKITDNLQVDLAYERMEMRGRDDVTPQSAYPRSKITTAGLKYSW
jgi:hypothetical protein